MIKIRHCPFCGCPAIVGYSWDSPRYYIRCQYCDVVMQDEDVDVLVSKWNSNHTMYSIVEFKKEI